jgi:polyhydroxybutyrate depolymerase
MNQITSVTWIVLSLSLMLGVASAQEDTLSIGSSTIEIDIGGTTRSYVAQVPNTYSPDAPVPLVLILHGTGGTPEAMLQLGHFYKHVELLGFIAAAPASLGRAFNDGSGRGGKEVENVNDVEFIEAVILDVRKRANVDPARIYMAGFSSGASMAQRFAVESASEVSAIFAPGGHYWISERTPARARPIFLMWGTVDKLNPVDGGEIPYRKSGVTLDKPSFKASATAWANRLECAQEPEEAVAAGGVSKLVWSSCNSSAVVELHIVEGLGHHWGGGRPIPFPDKFIGPYSDRVNATKMMWDFFERHAK